MQQGVVKTWIEDKGFGFIVPPDGGENVFVHWKAIVGAEFLEVGDLVSFETRYDERRGKLQASRCQVCGKAPPAPPKGGSAPVANLLGSIAPFPTCDPDGGCSSSVDHFLSVCGSEDPETTALFSNFVVSSSLECPFLVVSDRQLVAGIRAPSGEEFGRILRLVAAYLDGCEGVAGGALMTADFEGEMPGHGGELATAAFQLTSVIDPADLRPCPPPAGAPHLLGLLIDLRSEPCVEVVKRIMESARLVKVMWGADGDCISLMYQQLPTPLRMRPTAIIDAQLAFSSQDRRLGMGRMLKQVPEVLVAGLPEKEQVDWDSIHSCNRKALVLPLSGRVAAYAIDDLHRIEAILRSQVPPDGGYREARVATERVLVEIREDPQGLKSLQEQVYWLERSSANKRGAKAVAICRHVVSLRLRGLLGEGDTIRRGGTGLQDDLAWVEAAEDEAVEMLQESGVAVLQDLSWAV